MCLLGVTAREPRDPCRERLPSAISSESGPNQARIGPKAGSQTGPESDPEPDQNRSRTGPEPYPEPDQNRAGWIHPDPPRSTPDPPQIHPRSRCRSRSECRSRFNTQLIAYFAIRVLLWGNFTNVNDLKKLARANPGRSFTGGLLGC